MCYNIQSWANSVIFCVRDLLTRNTRPEGLLDPKIRDEMSEFLEIFPIENQI